MVAHFTMRTAHMEQIGHFDLLKSFDYIERFVKSDFFRKRPILHHTRARISELPSYISTMVVEGMLSRVCTSQLFTARLANIFSFNIYFCISILYKIHSSLCIYHGTCIRWEFRTRFARVMENRSF